MEGMVFVGCYKFENNGEINVEEEESVDEILYGIFFEKEKDKKFFYIKLLGVEEFDVNERNLEKHSSLWGIPILNILDNKIRKINNNVVKYDIFCINSKYWMNNLVKPFRPGMTNIFRLDYSDNNIECISPGGALYSKALEYYNVSYSITIV